VRLAVYCDMRYRSDGRDLSCRRAFASFLAGLPPYVGEVVLLGRLDPEPGRDAYALPRDGVRFVALPDYASGSDLRAVARAWRASCRVFRAELETVDAAWVLGPHPLAVTFAWIARRAGTPLVLGVRQDYPRYIAGRLPSRRWAWAVPAARALDAAFRRLARRSPAVVLGDALALRYGGGAPLLATAFSLVPAAEVVAADQAPAGEWDGELRLLSVTRLDPEKNPLLLVDVLARLRSADPRWHLTVAGTGPLRDALAGHAQRLGVAGALSLPGEVENGPRLWELYRSSHALLHVSLTEGLPQVLIEARAAGVPIVATDVGGVAGALHGGQTGLLVPAQDPEAAAAALERLAADPELRRTLVQAGLHHMAGQTREAQLARVASFIQTHAAT
jgi:glycosyltransferase involved in cell wall biosynthesis